MSAKKKNDNAVQSKTHATLDLIFISAVGVLMVAGLVSALTYEFVSARTPIVILIPLLILIGIQFRESLKNSSFADVTRVVADAFKGKFPEFNGAAGFAGWMVLLLILIFVAGQYAGMALFIFMLLYLVGGETLVLSLSISSMVTLGIYVLFAKVFGIGLYSGLVYQVWNGYSIF
jgi:hypothetical protein